MNNKQRGSAFSIKLAFTLYKYFGYNFIYYFIYLITAFYFLFATNVKDALKIYYKKQGIPFSSLFYYQHLRMFAITMVDRFISKYDPDSYMFMYENKDELRKKLNAKTILLFSHFGGWSSAANKAITNNTINIVMQEVMTQGIKDIENSIPNKKDNLNIIDLNQGAIKVSIDIANALSNNEVIALMADRASNKKNIHKSDFFNKKGLFNENPFKIAYKTKTPMLMYFVIYKKKQCYEVKVLELEFDYTLKEKDAIKKAINNYALSFEEVLKQHPKQWFNFYNFWSEE